MEQTLHEFMMATKAVEYLLAVAFLVVFVGFWTFLFKPSKEKADE